jgi:hypothetical protein
MTTEHVASLFVEAGGPYFDLPGVDPWDRERNAFLYRGPHPVIAHPPCERWGRYWGGGPSVRVPRKLGDDDGAFCWALTCVRGFGGVLEHPEASHAWAHFGLNAPPRDGRWVSADFCGGWTCCVEQGHYGHRARKATWLYACDTELPELRWGPSRGERLDEGFHSTEERQRLRAAGQKPRRRLNRAERVHTPIEFRNVLLWLARSVYRTKRQAA